MDVQTVKSPGGIEAWLVEEHALPTLALRFAFEGGGSQDPVGKDGLASFVAAMLSQGAGDMSGVEFQERLEDHAIHLEFEAGRDAVGGSLETLTEDRDVAVRLFRLAINEPRFDSDAVECIRERLFAFQANAARNPFDVASRNWDAVAFAGHPYARLLQGTRKTVGGITLDDLKSYCARTFARNALTVVAVGDITPKDLCRLLDNAFGDLPARADFVPLPRATPISGYREAVTHMDIPQSVVCFGMDGIGTDDPDYMAACVLNQIVGGDTMASKLAEELRLKRGLAFSIWTSVVPFRHASVFRGSISTCSDTVEEALDVIRDTLKDTAAGGIDETDLGSAKRYLIGSFPLSFDTNAKIASQLLRLCGFGSDFLRRRTALIAAVTLDDVKRVARRMLRTENLIVTIAGRATCPQAKAS